MKKRSITVLSGILTGLLLLSSCGNPFFNEPDSARKPALPESSGTVSARIFLPDYHKLAAQGRAIAPQSAKARLSIGSGGSTWTRHGDDLAVDWSAVQSVAGAPATLPGGIWTARFPALAAGYYAQGRLMIELLDAANQVITRGYNEDPVTIASNETASTRFFTAPAVSDSNAGSLAGDEMRFWRIYQMAYPYKITLTAAGSWPDIVLFNDDGTFHSYYGISGAGDSEITLSAAQGGKHYYIGIWADAGAVSSYNLAFEFNGSLNDVAAIADNFSGGLGAWAVTASGPGATPPSVVTDADTGKKAVEFYAAYSGNRASITRTIEAPVPMGLSFSIKTDIGDHPNVATAMVLYIDGVKMDSWSGLDGSWAQKSFTVDTGVHELKWVLEKDGNSYYPSATNKVWIGDITIVPDVTASVAIYPRAAQATYAGGFPIQYTAQALRSDGSVREGVTGFAFSGSGSGGSVNASTGVFTPSAEGTYTVSVSLDGKSASTGAITVHPADYLRRPYTYPGTGVTYNGYSGSEGTLTTSGGVTVTYPAGTTFNADGFFTLEGSVSNAAVYNYAYVRVQKDGLETFYLVRDTFKTRIWLRFGAGSYTVTVYDLGSITLSSGLGAEGDYMGCTLQGGITFTVTNTRSEAGVDGADRRFLYPSYVVQSDDFRVTNLAAELTFGISDATEKARAIHDYLVTNTVYDSDSFPSTDYRKKQDALTVLGTRYHIDTQYEPAGHYLAVCEGYANTSAALLRAAGFETKYISSSSMSHGWNNVYIGGWKFYDATWDDPVKSSGTTGDNGPDSVSHKYFLLNSLTGVDGDHSSDGTALQGRYAVSHPTPPRQRGVPDGWY